MMNRDRVTDALMAVRPGEDALELHGRLFEQVYDELRQMAASLLRRERNNHTLQPTALVHEAYLRLVDCDRVQWQGRAHFFGAAARAMRCILVDHARRKLASKRNLRERMVTLNEDLVPREDPQIDIVDLDDILNRLSSLDPRMARVVELRVFGGLTNRELALVLGLSVRTIDGDWAMAKRWLRRMLA